MNKEWKKFDIPISGLSEGEHKVEFDLDGPFFQSFDYQEAENASFHVIVDLKKWSNRIDAKISLKGYMTVTCDISNEIFDLELHPQANLIVKYGDEFDDSDDEVLIIPHGSHKLNIAQVLYEVAALSRPLRVIHPDIASGKRKTENSEILEQLSPESERETQDEIDPRWDKLRKLLD